MNDNFIRHFISLMAVLVCGLAWWSGYVSGGYGWWWTVASVLIIYLAVYKLLDM